MKKLALVVAVLAFAACSKADQDPSKSPKEPSSPAPAVAAAPTAPTAPPAAAEPAPPATKPVHVTDPASLPAPGTAPTPVAVGKELEAMWSAPIKTLKGEPTTLAAYKGKALMVVNVASRCGNTPQYSTLEALQKKYADKGFTVVGFPTNQFMGQEPGTAEEIAEFCAINYGITFPIMEKTEVNGDQRNPVYKALTPIPDASGHKGDIRWNFEKFVVSADGKQVTRFSPKTKPEDPAVIASVEAALPR